MNYYNLDHRSGNFVHPIETVLDNTHINLKIILNIYHMLGFYAAASENFRFMVYGISYHRFHWHSSHRCICRSPSDTAHFLSFQHYISLAYRTLQCLSFLWHTWMFLLHPCLFHIHTGYQRLHLLLELNPLFDTENIPCW